MRALLSQLLMCTGQFPAPAEAMCLATTESDVTHRHGRARTGASWLKAKKTKTVLGTQVRTSAISRRKRAAAIEVLSK